MQSRMVSRRRLIRLALLLPFGASVRTAAQDRVRFFVIGYVRKPGSYEYQADLSVGAAIEIAGGIVRSIKTIEILRQVEGEKVTIPAALNDAVLPFDIVRVK